MHVARRRSSNLLLLTLSVLPHLGVVGKSSMSILMPHTSFLLPITLPATLVVSFSEPMVVSTQTAESAVPTLVDLDASYIIPLAYYPACYTWHLW